MNGFLLFQVSTDSSRLVKMESSKVEQSQRKLLDADSSLDWVNFNVFVKNKPQN